MGTWGVGICDNDTACEVYSDYIELLKIISSNQVMEKMLSHYKSKINSYEEQNNFWFAIAFAQLETNTVKKEIFEKVESIILTEQDLKLWKELKASEKELV